VALAAAREVPVLLKNDGTLPLNPARIKTLAVIGPNAAAARLGGYTGTPRQIVTMLDGIRARTGSGIRIVSAPGVKITQDDDWWADKVSLADRGENEALIRQAVETARMADQIVLVLGDTEQTSREGWAASHLGDRASLDLVGQQDELADAIFALGKPVVVILLNGRPLSVNNVAAKANALIEGWYLGQEGGTAMAEILFGDVNPSGHLPVTIPRSVGQLPMFYNYKPSAHRGYLFDAATPLFPFGYGLSYTSFEIGAPRISAPDIAPGESVTVQVDVRNSGARAGDAVVQLYIHDKVSSVTRPVKELKGFRRVSLNPGETRTASFTLGPRELGFWDVQMKRKVEPGEFEIMAGDSSVNLKTTMLNVHRAVRNHR
jgi:beta-glucosidase